MKKLDKIQQTDLTALVHSFQDACADKEYKDFVYGLNIKEEVLIDHVYPYTESGEIIELPKGSTIIDFAFEVNPDLAEHMTGALVNGKEVPFNYKVQNHDTIQIIAKGIPDRTNWEEFAYNMSTKLKIKEKESK